MNQMTGGCRERDDYPFGIVPDARVLEEGAPKETDFGG
jgi:hypothetical protein